MNTKAWGPAGWMFSHTITFNYPDQIDFTNDEQTKLANDIKLMFRDYRNTLPCKYCRESFAKFLKQLPIEPFLGSRKALTFWFYSIHNKVNQKLRGQEWELFLKLLRKKINRALKNKNLGNLLKNDVALQKDIAKLKDDILFTKPDPSYTSVCQFYESHRAQCHPSKNKIKSCRL